MIGLVVILALSLALVVYFVGIYNGLVNLRENVKFAWANIDVLLKQRQDELPKLVETCKLYMKFEQETQIAYEISGALALANRANDDSNTFGNIQLAQNLP